MNRSRLFLGLTTACLAVAGIVAAKARTTDNASVFYKTSIASKCVKSPILSGFTYDATSLNDYAYTTALRGGAKVIPGFYTAKCDLRFAFIAE